MGTAIVVMSTKAPARWLLQSAIHMLLLPVGSLATFYSGYRGLAEPDSTLAFRFRIAQPILGFAYFLLGLVPWGCANGLAKLGEMGQYTDGSTFWTLIIIVESLLWLANALLAAVNSYRAHNFDVYESAGVNTPG